MGSSQGSAQGHPLHPHPMSHGARGPSWHCPKIAGGWEAVGLGLPGSLMCLASPQCCQWGAPAEGKSPSPRTGTEQGAGLRGLLSTGTKFSLMKTLSADEDAGGTVCIMGIGPVLAGFLKEAASYSLTGVFAKQSYPLALPGTGLMLINRALWRGWIGCLWSQPGPSRKLHITP